MGLRVTRSALPFVALVAFTTCSSVDAFARAPHPPAANPAPVKETPPEKARAAELYKKGAEAYLRGDFAQTITLLDEANALDPQPVLVYNLAKAHEGLGHVDEAITLYERYLTQEPSSPDRGAIEQRLVMLRKQRDDRANVEKERTAVEKERAQVEKERAEQPPPPPPHRRTIYPYIVAGAGVVGLVTGTIFGVMANSKQDAATKEPVQSTSIDLRDSGKTFATVSNVTFIIGGVLVAGGVVWWFLDAPKKSRTGATPARLGLGPGYVGLGGTFQ